MELCFFFCQKKDHGCVFYLFIFFFLCVFFFFVQIKVAFAATFSRRTIIFGRKGTKKLSNDNSEIASRLKRIKN